MGTNTDPYQRAEGRYQLMPDVIGALAASETPFSILTKGTLLSRDLPLLAEAARRGAGRHLHFPGGSRSRTAARSGARHPDAAGPAGADPPDPRGRTALRRSGGADPAGPHRRSASGWSRSSRSWRRPGPRASVVSSCISAREPGNGSSPGWSGSGRTCGLGTSGCTPAARAPRCRTGARSRSASGPSWTAPGWRAGNSAAERSQTYRRHPLSRPGRSWASRNCSDGSPQRRPGPAPKSSGLTWEQWQELLASRTHPRRLMTLTEMADVAVFMACDKASGVTGTIVNLTMGSLDD